MSVLKCHPFHISGQKRAYFMGSNCNPMISSRPLTPSRKSGTTEWEDSVPQMVAWLGLKSICGATRWWTFSPSLCCWIFCVKTPCLAPVFQTIFQPFEEDMASYFPSKCKTPTSDGSLCWLRPQSLSYNINNRSKHELMWRSCQLFQTTIDQSQETPVTH